MSATARRDHIREMLADLKLPGALEAVDDILADVDRGSLTASEAVERLLDAQITLRNNRRLQTAMRSSRLPAIKTLEQFDFAFQPSIQRLIPSRTYFESECSTTCCLPFNALSASITAVSSMRLLVVSGEPPCIVLRRLPEISNTPQPPGPGFPLQAPSVYISTVFVKTYSGDSG